MKKASRLNNVQTKLISMMLLVTLIPIIALGSFSVMYSQKIVKDEVENSTVQLVNEVSNRIDTLTNGIGGQITLLSNNINFTDYYLNPENAKYGFFLLDGTRLTREDYKHLYFATERNDFMISPKESGEGLPDDFDPTTRDWYQSAVNNKGQLVTGTPYKDVATGDLVVTLSKTVEKAGEVIGVIGVDVDLGKLAEVTNEIVVGHEGYAVLVDREGTLITHPNQELIGTDVVTKLSVWEDIQKNQEGVSNYEYDGKEKFSVYSTNESTGWHVLATLEEKEFTSRTKGLEFAIFALMAGFIVISAVLAFFFSKGIVKNIRTLQQSIQTASEGDLTTRVSLKSKDEFKQLEESYNRMMNHLSKALTEVEASSQTVLSTSSSLSKMTDETTSSISQVAIAMGEVAEGTASQTENIQTVAEEMEQLSSNLDDIKAVTNDMLAVQQHSVELGEKGLNHMNLLTNKSTDTKASSNQVSAIIGEVADSMKGISAFIDTITGISEQTNLLSLNASIEAARAGEHGKGFAVVAQEVRKLAEESQRSADQVVGIIQNIEQVVEKAVESVESTNRTVEEQEKAVEETKEIFASILRSLEEVTRKSEEVRASIEIGQQSKDIVSEQTSNISAISEQTASATEEVSASAEEISATMEEFSRHANGLEGLSRKLEEQVRQFKLR
jgi:methyl-accepting chemotaxis protein